jgi:Response regulators consisting of a CheY-like receiver domain and a winged-helix DNA-binding domain
MEKKMRILLVEDETDLLTANRQYLADKGYEVHCAESLQKARAIAWEYPPDLVLLDVMLPDGSGYDFCAEMRKVSAVPIIFLTALGADRDIVSGLVLGGDDYIVKPYSMEVMGARVAAQLRRREAAGGVVALPPLFVDVAAGVVQLNGEEIALTRKEVQMLVYFIEYQGQERTPEQIYKAVWGGEQELIGSTVRANISRLRQKLALGSSEYFELASTANQGYIFLRVKFPTAE